MKALIKYFFGFMSFLSVLAMSSCERTFNDKFGKGKAEFNLNMPEEISKSSGAASDEGIPSYHILVSIVDFEGNPVITDSLLPVYAFGPAFTSENLELKAGDYNLIKFLVIAPSGDVIYAAPVEGSPLAYLVNDPLPIGFTIHTNAVTKVAPEVILVGDHTPGDFGYASFGMQIIKPLDFWTICILDCPMCASPIQLTTALLTIYAGNNWHYTFKLEAAINHLVIRGGSSVYYFLLEKEGYMPQKLEFTAAELMATTKENPLVLRIPWDSNQWKTLVLQPGPDAGKDAMISNLDGDKNFGDYKYFEATYISEPVLTVMRSNRSLIWFDMNALPKSAIIRKVTLQLFYDIPVPWDINAFITWPVTSSVWYGGVLQQIVEPWEEDKVTWNNQPQSITANQVFISPFIRNVNFITVDVTTLFVPVNEIAAANYGMFFKLWPMERFPGFRFASSDFPDATMRPRLTVYYTL